MNDLLNRLNAILSDWKTHYDIFSAVSMQFQVDDREQLCFNGKPLCSAADLAFISSYYDLESIHLYFTANRIVKIQLLWPEEQPPIISAVLFGYDVNAAETAT